MRASACWRARAACCRGGATRRAARVWPTRGRFYAGRAGRRRARGAYSGCLLATAGSTRARGAGARRAQD
eukprot:scaffold36015_cov68-Phaeocystis_antarctica.AAC.1